MRREKLWTEQFEAFEVPLGGAGSIALSPVLVVNPEHLADEFISLQLRLKVNSFDGATLNVFFYGLDNAIYPRVSSFDAATDGWMATALRAAELGQSADGSVYLTLRKDWVPANAFRFGIGFYQTAGAGAVNIHMEVEGWVEM
jgi:hypothetical protein